MSHASDELMSIQVIATMAVGNSDEASLENYYAMV